MKIYYLTFYFMNNIQVWQVSIMTKKKKKKKYISYKNDHSDSEKQTSKK